MFHYTNLVITSSFKFAEQEHNFQRTMRGTVNLLIVICGLQMITPAYLQILKYPGSDPGNGYYEWMTQRNIIKCKIELT